MIVPEALYPRFKLQLDKFGNDTSEASPYEPDEPNEVDSDEAGNLPTGNDRLSKALNTANPSKTDKIIKRMLQSDEQEDVEIPTDLRNIKKPRSYNKRKEDKKEKSKPGYSEPVNIQESQEELAHVQVPDDQPEQPQEDEGEQYEAPEVVQPQNIVTENIQPHSEPAPDPQFEEVQTTTRRSKRIPKLSAKALNLIECDQWYNNENE